MMWWAIGSLVMLALAAAAAGIMLWHGGFEAGYEAHRDEMAENRAERRAERRARAAGLGHQLAPFPDEAEFEKLATTGELRAMAESGDLESLRRESAAFSRIIALREWTRKRASA